MKKNLDWESEAHKSFNMHAPYTSFHLKGLQETIALGQTLLDKDPLMEILLLEGPLGAGKTSLVKGIALALQIQEPITSPTFALAQHYSEGKRPLVHLDLYRLETTQEAEHLFFEEEEEALSKGALIVIEWPERIKIKFSNAWKVKLSYLKNEGRLAHVRPPECSNKNLSTS